MTMKQKLETHRSIEAENRQAVALHSRYEYAKERLGFYPASESELMMFECNGFDDVVYMYR